jgi:hypothetical protein
MKENIQIINEIDTSHLQSEQTILPIPQNEEKEEEEIEQSILSLSEIMTS